MCIRFEYYTHKCEESNIINNSQKISSCGCVRSYSETKVNINKCCLIKNNVNGNGYLFYVEGSGTMEVRDCTIQSGYRISSTSGGRITTSYSNKIIGNIFDYDDFNDFMTKLKGCNILYNNLINQIKCKYSVYEPIIFHNFNKNYINKAILL
jgi:hypothetical protein